MVVVLEAPVGTEGLGSVPVATDGLGRSVEVNTGPGHQFAAGDGTLVGAQDDAVTVIGITDVVGGDGELGAPEVRDAGLRVGLHQVVQTRSDNHDGTLGLVQGRAVCIDAGVVRVQLRGAAVRVHQVTANLGLVGLPGGDVSDEAPRRRRLGSILERDTPRHLVKQLGLAFIHCSLEVLHRDTAYGAVDLDQEAVRFQHGSYCCRIC